MKRLDSDFRGLNTMLTILVIFLVLGIAVYSTAEGDTQYVWTSFFMINALVGLLMILLTKSIFFISNERLLCKNILGLVLADIPLNKITKYKIKEKELPLITNSNNILFPLFRDAKFNRTQFIRLELRDKKKIKINGQHLTKEAFTLLKRTIKNACKQRRQ